MKIINRVHDWAGYSWNIKLWNTRGIVFSIYTSCIAISIRAEYCWAEECKYINVQFMNLDLTFFWNTDWE